jgi:hypothetical protein
MHYLLLHITSLIPYLILLFIYYITHNIPHTWTYNLLSSSAYITRQLICFDVLLQRPCATWLTSSILLEPASIPQRLLSAASTYLFWCPLYGISSLRLLHLYELVFLLCTRYGSKCFRYPSSCTSCAHSLILESEMPWHRCGFMVATETWLRSKLPRST